MPMTCPENVGQYLVPINRFVVGMAVSGQQMLIPTTLDATNDPYHQDSI